ncbi:sensor histidine kinase [Agromyces aerolatus]|uniref:sensor histidine kinase n=1 Tax=Agromyces sp. LY-1074 TaxID=3074080 RepID=UPI002861FF7E|nr:MULTISPECIES: histidine kinase [unclassified Agromyces]MDR5698578.1 histidine kinase [Agromyces sp. LY-1074]MDR5704872.1 histidine kinase [Agromyces sp. LY-1358]
MSAPGGPAGAARAARRPLLLAGLSIVALAWIPLAAMVAVSAIASIEWSGTLRLLITAVVYAPVAAIALTRRRAAVAIITGALAVTSAWFALAVIVGELPGTRPEIDGVVRWFAFLARQPELAALAILPWLLLRTRGRLRTSGVAFGLVAIVGECVTWVLWFGGVPPTAWIDLLPLLAALASFIAAAIALAGEWRSGTDRERQALTWLAVGAVLLILSYVRVVAPLPPMAAVVADAAFVLAQGLLPTAILAVLLGGREIASDRRLAGGIVWVQSLALAVSLYLVVNEAAVLLGMPEAVAGAFAAGALALSFSAVSRFVRRRTALLYFGPGADARQVLGRLGERLAVAGDDTGIRGIAESLLVTWQLSSVTIAPAADADPVAVGRTGAARLATELRAGGRPVGTIELTSDDETVLEHRVRPVLEDLAGLIAVAVLLASVNQEVAATRRRTLGVRREERRMLHRELHDELAPALAGIGFGMAAASRLIETGDPAAEASIAELREQVAVRTEDVRRLARTMLPAALDAGDLDGALRELAQRFSGDGLDVDVHSGGTDVLDAGVQIALYLALAEAVSRLRREAGVHRIDVHVGMDDARATARLRAVGARPTVAAWRALLDATTRRALDVGGVVAAAADAHGHVIEITVRR